jgi:hypothetical protein
MLPRSGGVTTSGGVPLAVPTTAINVHGQGALRHREGYQYPLPLLICQRFTVRGVTTSGGVPVPTTAISSNVNDSRSGGVMTSEGVLVPTTAIKVNNDSRSGALRYREGYQYPLPLLILPLLMSTIYGRGASRHCEGYSTQALPLLILPLLMSTIHGRGASRHREGYSTYYRY